ncbi:13370_t:CDS:2 [Funneliformis geosporum]|uniref:17151_t:CDS:1 n=1 Tax=Funneliformis geosporum TaxID=1117311 RepID=A0A9W4WWS2_9GLOM|nr:13370_t:CDS:2 [Funneliformis geosporum]CAI2177989.1 17151_t:CDS:2 [Funneliformis geosporum]
MSTVVIRPGGPTEPQYLPARNYSTVRQTNNNAPHFEYVSYDRVQDLYEQRKGHFYFIPEGFEPVLVPNDSKAQTVTNLLETSKPVSTAPNVSRMLPDTDVRLPSFALPCGVSGPSKKETAPNGKIPKVKKPPRPPNAFILYRRAKQPTIVAQHQGITNNEVSKEIGKLWHSEPMEVRLKFQKMAEAAKEEHMKKYPEYRYRPRRPQERKRRVNTRESVSRRSSPPVLSHHLTTPMAENPEYIPRRVSSISSDGGENGYNANPSVSTIPNQPVYYANSEINSPTDNYENSSMPPPPQFTSYSQQSMNDYSVFEPQPHNMSNISEDAIEFTDFEDYNDYNQQIVSLMGSADHHYPHQYITKNDY